MTSRIWPSESRYLTEETGVVVRQATCHPSLHHHPFFFVDCFDDAMRHLVFISHRTGTPQIFVEDQTRHELIQLTEKDGIAEWSLIPSRDGRWIYYVAGRSGYRVSPQDGHSEQLVYFGDVEMREKGMVGAAMGTTALLLVGRSRTH